jgi:diamine N-acetyltransferase
MRVRRAQRADAGPLAALAEHTFREAFEAVNTPENMARHCRDSYGEATQAREIADRDRITLLCESHGELAGYAQLRWGVPPAGVAATSPGEIQRLYVASAFHGRGVAHALMDACLAELAARGSDVAWLGVWEHNPRAIAFYSKYGFVAVGEQVFPVGDDPQRDLVMCRPLPASRDAAQPPGA